jgi:hypothetical protein
MDFVLGVLGLIYVFIEVACWVQLLAGSVDDEPRRW